MSPLWRYLLTGNFPIFRLPEELSTLEFVIYRPQLPRSLGGGNSIHFFHITQVRAVVTAYLTVWGALGVEKLRLIF